MTAEPVTSRTPAVLFLVNSLRSGGTEKQLVTLLNRLDTRRFKLHFAYLERNEQLLPQLERDWLTSLVCMNGAHRLDIGAVGACVGSSPSAASTRS